MKHVAFAEAEIKKSALDRACGPLKTNMAAANLAKLRVPVCLDVWVTSGVTFRHFRRFGTATRWLTIRYFFGVVFAGRSLGRSHSQKA